METTSKSETQVQYIGLIVTYILVYTFLYFPNSEYVCFFYWWLYIGFFSQVSTWKVLDFLLNCCPFLC